ncbi:truncated transposase [Escherichia coli]|uniref:Truncated transposase n=1 Tax=Escherichia coli TaxID=562 RepID=A0A376TF30_ECOLX|nr:truncated transposase [Escherichia coli]
MSKSAAGTVSQPGRNVRAKSGLNRSILDQGWYEMRRQLEYKQLWRGGQVLAVPPSVHKPALRVLWSYSERKPPVTK